MMGIFPSSYSVLTGYWQKRDVGGTEVPDSRTRDSRFEMKIREQLPKVAPIAPASESEQPNRYTPGEREIKFYVEEIQRMLTSQKKE